MWTSATIREAGVCAEHFDQEPFADETHQSLRRYAVPMLCSAMNARAKPSPTFLTRLESLPRNQTLSREITDFKDARREIEGLNSNPDEPISGPEEPMPVRKAIAVTVKTLRKVKRIKIEEQASNSNRTIILEKCKNLETCPASSRATREGGKSWPHFHNVRVNSEEKIRASTPPGISAKPLKVRKFDDGNSISEHRKVDERSEAHCESTATTAGIWDEGTTKVKKKPTYRLERYQINLSKAVPKKEETSTTSRYSGDPEQENVMSNWQAIQDSRAETVLERVRKDINKKYFTTAEFLEDYYKTKEERSFDRCAYVNCKNGRFTTGAHLFRFPKTTDPRLTTWIKNAGNPRMLFWSWSTIRRAGICGDHFTDNSFYNESHQRLLRTALPKPFYLEKNVSSGNKQEETLSPDDLLKVFHIIENGYEVGADEPPEPVPIDLPNDKSENRESLKIRYPFEDSEFIETENDAEVCNSAVLVNAKEESYESFASVTVKTESTDWMEDDESEEMLNAASGLKEELIEEPEEDPLDDITLKNGNELDEDSQEVGNIGEILALQQQESRLCKVIKLFSTKLREAKIHKTKLRSQLSAYSDLEIH